MNVIDVKKQDKDWPVPNCTDEDLKHIIGPVIAERPITDEVTL